MQTTSIDENGRPRKKRIVLITDGFANVLYDKNAYGLLNLPSLAPFHCGTNLPYPDMDRASVQYTCPDVSYDYPDYGTGIRPPIRAAIDVATALRTNNQIETYAVLLNGFGLDSISDMKLDQIAPHFAVEANQVSDLTPIFADLNAQFQTVQCSVVSETRPAIGANVTIKDASNTIVVQGTTDASGIFTATLSPTTYMVSAEHLNIVAPNDSEAISRTYRLASTAFNPINPPAPFLLTRDPATPLCP